jgi:hypothetical protein
MRRIGIGLVAALIVGALAPVAVLSATKQGDVTDAARKQGMAEAPAFATAAGLTCKVADARFIGKNEDKKTKVATSFYEVDCDQGLGFVLQVISDQPKPNTFSCIETGQPGADGKAGSLACKLPGNQDSKADLAPLLQKAGVACAVDKVRAIGQSPSNSYLEVACQGGGGFVLEAGAPPVATSPVQATTCLLYDDANSNIKCELSDKAARLAVVEQLAAQAKVGCTIKDKRYVLTTKDGDNYFEASCADGKGYMFKATPAGQLGSALECAKADFVGGGCTLTDTRAAQTEQAGLYTRLAKGAGFDCTVGKYAPLPSPAGKDVVELQCSNRPDGAIGVFASPASSSVVYDCARAQIAGYRCVITKADAANKYLTEDLKKLGKTTCEVKSSRLLGKTAKGTAFLEVNCTDGLAGYMIEYAVDPRVNATGVTGCAFAKGIAGGCKLPGNT